jgi:hypothetical protein
LPTLLMSLRRPESGHQRLYQIARSEVCNYRRRCQRGRPRIAGDAGITSERDFNGKIIATPQLGTRRTSRPACGLERRYKLRERAAH